MNISFAGIGIGADDPTVERVDEDVDIVGASSFRSDEDLSVYIAVVNAAPAPALAAAMTANVVLDMVG